MRNLLTKELIKILLTRRGMAWYGVAWQKEPKIKLSMNKTDLNH